MMLALAAGEQREETLAAATTDMATFANASGEKTLPWKLVDDRAVLALLRRRIAQAPAEVLAAWLRQARSHRVIKADGVEFRTLLGELRRRDSSLAAAVEIAPAAPPMAGTTTTAEATPAAPAPAGDIAPEVDPLAALSAAGAAPADEATSAKTWDAALFDKTGKISRSAYVRACASLDLRDVDRRLGPGWTFFHKDGGSDDAPEIPQKIANGVYEWLKPNDAAVDWTGLGGQIAFVPEKEGSPGISRASFCWSEHENHGGKALWHRYWLRTGIGKPDGGQWWSEPVDPCLTQGNFRTAMRDDPGRTPVAMGRARTSWSNHAVVAFRNGVLTTSGSGNSGDKFPIALLPKGKVPTAVALTGGNEFALVTVWDVNQLKAQVAIIAMRAKRWMIPANGFFEEMRFIGLVDLPDSMRTPTAIASSCDFVIHDINQGVDADWNLADAAVRKRWLDAEPGGVRTGIGYPRRGYAVIASRAENRLVLLDLAPLFRWVRAECLEKAPPTEPAWPGAIPDSALPKVAATLPVPQPTFVTCGWPTERKPTPWATRFLVGTLDGRIAAFDAGSLASLEVKLAQPTATGLVQVGRNPCAFSHGSRQGGADRMWIVCRGERTVLELDVGGSTPRVLRTLRDRRLQDPVS
ncbi:MAG: hypothetical protein H0W72_00395, partial [Planctomycetes bacterium]|nr:hypothetical protein [Planctomycetota bacterium]